MPGQAPTKATKETLSRRGPHRKRCGPFCVLDKDFTPQQTKLAMTNTWNLVRSSRFADVADKQAFSHCKRQGHSDQFCFAVGDNCVGCWGDATDGDVPACALPPDDMIARFGEVLKARHALVEVRVQTTGKVVVLRLLDRMPWRRNIKNGRGIDLNPAACRALGVGGDAHVEWRWTE